MRNLPEALKNNDSRRAASLKTYLQRLRKELSAAEQLLYSKQKDLEVAVERATIVAEELLNARVEKRKIEKLLEKRSHSEKLLSAAKEEVSIDELLSSRRRK
ncbi:hypothetical protein BVY02_02540 [bacterium J17]|nr:hypothetical protein BVY02_02540 [bacterium J17]